MFWQQSARAQRVTEKMRAGRPRSTVTHGQRSETPEAVAPTLLAAAQPPADHGAPLVRVLEGSVAGVPDTELDQTVALRATLEAPGTGGGDGGGGEVGGRGGGAGFAGDGCGGCGGAGTEEQTMVAAKRTSDADGPAQVGHVAYAAPIPVTPRLMLHVLLPTHSPRTYCTAAAGVAAPEGAVNPPGHAPTSPVPK